MAIYAHGKVGEAYTLRFPCRSKTTGLLLSGEVGFTAKVRKNDETLLSPDPSVTELTTGSALGEYKLTFTPDAEGKWSVKISQANMYDIYVDVFVESQQLGDVAPGATALSTAQWTNTRAGYIDLLNTYLDATISSRLASAGYTAPDNASITAIKAKTDNLPADPASDTTVNTRAPASTALDNTVWTNAKAAFIDAAISSRLASASYTTPPTVGDIADAVWDEPIAGHVAAGSTGEALNNAGGASPADIADAVWDEATSGHTAVGSFGKLFNDNVDATISSRAPSATALSTAQWTNGRASNLDNLDTTVSSRLASASYTAPDNATISTINTKIGTPVTSVSADVAAVKSDTSSIKTTVDTNLDVTVGSRAPASTALDNTVWTNAKAAFLDSAISAVPTQVWASGTRTLTSFGTLVSDIWSNPTRTLTSGGGISAADVWDYLTSSISTSGSIGKLLTDNIDATISSRLSSVGYTAPDNAGITAIKAKTDNLPVDPASDTTVNTRAPASTALSNVDWTALKASYLDAAISSRLAGASYTAPDNAAIATINTKLGTPVTSVSADIAAVKADTAAIETDTSTYLDATISSRAPSATALSTAQWTNGRASNLDNLDALVSSRLATAGYTSPDNAGISAIKAKTDNLPVDPASDTTVNTRAPASTALSNTIWTDAKAAFIDVATSSRLATAGYTAPDNATISTINTKVGTPLTTVSGDIAAVKAETATIQSAVSLNLDVTVSSRLAAAAYTAPDNAGVSEAVVQATLARKYAGNKAIIDPLSSTLTVYDDDGTTPLLQIQFTDENGDPSLKRILQRLVV